MTKKLSEKSTQFHEINHAISRCRWWGDIEEVKDRIDSFEDQWTVKKTPMLFWSFKRYDYGAMDMTRQLKENLCYRIDDLVNAKDHGNAA